MNKTELVDRIAAESKVSKRHTAKVIDKFIDVVREELDEGGEIKINGLGNFFVRQRGSHKARNPRTGETVHAEPKKFIKFRCSTTLESYINSEKEELNPN